LKYRLVYTRRAIRDIEALDPMIKQRIGSALNRYEENPLRFAERLTNPKLGTFRFRIGNYRVIFDLEGRDIVVLRVGHRRDIYRGF